MDSKQFSRGVALGVGVLLAIPLSLILSGCGGEAPSDRPQTVEAAQAAGGEAGAAGLKAYVDPETGRLTAAPPADALPETAPPGDAGLAGRHEGLYQTLGPRGGARVDLRGRFHSALVATVEEDGTVTTREVLAIIGSGERTGDDPAREPEGGEDHE